MLQLLTLLAWSRRCSFTADQVRDEKVKVLRAIRAPEPARIEEVACAGSTRRDGGGEDVPGYLDEQDVPDDSTTETYAALRLEVDNWRWAGVPFYLRTGKRLARKVTEIAGHAQAGPAPRVRAGRVARRAPEQLVFTVQPNEGVSLSLGAKIPGTRMSIRPVNMEFLYGTSFCRSRPRPTSGCILDAMRGDATLFTRDDEVEAQWRIIDPVLEGWARLDAAGGRPAQYEAGTKGPAEADRLLLDDDQWRAI
jgi:glucose-6-phosphate 1-dehydrogenase